MLAPPTLACEVSQRRAVPLFTRSVDSTTAMFTWVKAALACSPAADKAADNPAPPKISWST